MIDQILKVIEDLPLSEKLQALETAKNKVLKPVQPKIDELFVFLDRLDDDLTEEGIKQAKALILELEGILGEYYEDAVIAKTLLELIINS